MHLLLWKQGIRQALPSAVMSRPLILLLPNDFAGLVVCGGRARPTVRAGADIDTVRNQVSGEWMQGLMQGSGAVLGFAAGPSLAQERVSCCCCPDHVLGLLSCPVRPSTAGLKAMPSRALCAWPC